MISTILSIVKDEEPFDEELYETAVHEAEHAVCSYMVGEKIRFISIEPRKETGGRMISRSLTHKVAVCDMTDDQLLDYLATYFITPFLDGDAFEQKGNEDDLDVAFGIINFRCDSDSEKVGKMIGKLVDRTLQITEHPHFFDAVYALADILYERGKIGGHDATQLIKEILEGE